MRKHPARLAEAHSLFNFPCECLASLRSWYFRQGSRADRLQHFLIHPIGGTETAALPDVKSPFLPSDSLLVTRS